jgi:hypothetical protein
VEPLAAPGPKPFAKRVRTATYSVGIYLVGLIVLLQLAAMLSVFWLRHAVQIDLEAPKLRAPAFTATSEAAPVTASSLPLATPLATAPVVREPTLLQPRVTGRLSLSVVLEPKQRLASLNREAAKFIQNGDIDLAWAALLEAENLEPSHPPTLLQAAELADLQKDLSRARTYWQRLVTLGPQAFPEFSRAEARLQALTLSQGPLTAGQFFLVDPVQIQTIKPAGDPTAEQLKFRVPIRLLARDQEIETGNIIIQFYFYDETETHQILPSQAERRILWASKDPRWQGEGVEILEASYLLKKESSGRRFYGYVFRLFYKGKLQDERSSPDSLLALFPRSEGTTP